VDVGGEQTTGAGAKIGADQIERFAPVSVTEYLLVPLAPLILTFVSAVDN
jgi:hypothetical protein